MTIADILAVQVTLDGMNRVIDGFDNLARSVGAADESLSRLGKTGAVVTAVGVGLAGMALTSYESFARMERSFQSMLGMSAGGKMTQDILRMGEASQFTSEEIRRIATQWMNMTGQIQKTLPMIRAMETAGILGGQTNDQFGRMGVALAQIQAQGKVMWMDYMQLVNANAPVSAISRQMGLKSSKDLIGQDGTKFTDAFMAAMKKVSAGQQSLLSVRFMNAWETFTNGLIKTGALITVLAAPVALLVEGFVKVFAWLNNVTGGLLGLVIIVALVVTGFRLMWTFIQGVLRAYVGHTVAVRTSTGALELLTLAARKAAISLGAVGAGSAVGGAASGVGGAAGGAAAGLTFGAIISKLGSLLQWFIGGLMVVVGFLSVFIVAILPVIAAIAVIGGIMLGIIKGLEAIFGPPGGDPEEAFGTGKKWRSRMPDWLPTWLGGPDPKPAKQDAAQRPQRRSSWENVYDRRWGHRMGG